MIKIEINKVYDAVIGGNFRAVMCDGHDWLETDEYDDELQDYVNWTPTHLTRQELEKIVGGEFEVVADE